MSGGQIAIRGFDYQATVILDRLFEHFDKHGTSANVHPENEDDLDLTWIETDGSARCRYEQVKKPREDINGNRKAAPWSLREVLDELLPNTLKRLAGNAHEQVWILGDEVDADVGNLIAAGRDAPVQTSALYYGVLHKLARQRALHTAKLKEDERKKLQQWKVPEAATSDPATAFKEVTDAFRLVLKSSTSPDSAVLYDQAANSLHGQLPDVLARTTVESLYGSEETVGQRVCDTLEQRYNLPPAVVTNTLFRNLRGFINDISKQTGRKFNKEEFEYELRSVWPQMLAVKAAPSLPPNYIARLDITDRFAKNWAGKAIEAIGVSGSGKTALAAEAITRSQAVDPRRMPIYVEVTSMARLRDVLVGVGFHLRRFNLPNQFAVAIEGGITNQEAIERLARSFSSLSQEIFLVLDLVEGRCSDDFARDLACFISNSTSGACRVLVLAQESAFRTMSAVDRQAQEVTQTDVRGLRFEEFATLVAHQHPQADRARLHDIFTKVTAGRAAGLFASLAQALAGAASLEAMEQAANQPGGDMLRFAERQKFARISPHARLAAEKLICFALPFTRNDAEACFSADNIGLAIRELRDLGLLRANDADTFEMHETIRAGLEDLLSPKNRQNTQAELAAWYHTQGLATAEILHLEKAGKHDDATLRARETVLSGNHWASLAPWIIKNQAVSATDVLNVIASTQSVSDRYVLPSLVRNLKPPVEPDALFDVIQSQHDRFVGDYQWGMALTNALLGLDPNRLTPLVAFILRTYSDPQKRQTALSHVLLTAKRQQIKIDRSILMFFSSATPEIKNNLLPLLLLESSRESLTEVFRFVSTEEALVERNSRCIPPDLILKIDDQADALEVLHAIPDVDIARMLATKSPLLGSLATSFWQYRANLHQHCIDILNCDASTIDAKVAINAIRLLVFFMEPRVGSICESIHSQTQDEQLKGFLSLAPIMTPALIDRDRYQARLFDKSAPLSDRITALSILAACGADMGALYQGVLTAEDDPSDIAAWEFLFLQLSAQNPFPEAASLARNRLASADANELRLLSPVIFKLGALATSDSDAMLTEALAHPEADIRQIAALAIAGRRSKAFLPALTAQFNRATNLREGMSVANAIIASGPDSVSVLGHPSIKHPALLLWQCILTRRLRDSSLAKQVVITAADSSLDWQVRRAAIAAAGRLPFDSALKDIQVAIMAEQSPLSIDRHQGLCCHVTLIHLLLFDLQALLSSFQAGKQAFTQLLAEPIASMMQPDLWLEGMPSGQEAAEWLFDRLSHHGWPSQNKAPDLVINELSVPLLQSAVLRSLGEAGRFDLIENQLVGASSIWLAIKCLIHRRRGPHDPNLRSRLLALIEKSQQKDELILQRVLDDVVGTEASASAAVPTQTDEAIKVDAPPGSHRLRYDDSLKILRGEIKSPPFDLQNPFVLEGITKEQFEHLVLLSDPLNDRHEGVETYVPGVSFTETGHSVSRLQTTYRGDTEAAGSILRPSIAAANVFGVPIPWHLLSMSGTLASRYIPRLLASLNAQDDSSRFYQELGAYPDLLLPELCKAAVPRFGKHIDQRVAPLVASYATSGNDQFFESLCTLASRVDGPEIDPALAALFNRWVQKFDLRLAAPQNSTNYELWRGFRLLTEHPRFRLIPDWQAQTANVMRLPLDSYRKQTIARVFEQHPGSYMQTETMLFKEADWRHFLVDEITQLDQAADRLFHATTD